MFEKTLTDVVKGIRASKRDTGLYISQCIAEIKTEINSSDMFVKANGLQKLTFLQMMGYSMNWASFATIEVMSSPRFAHKRIGYLAASQGFTQDTEVILLTTNLLKKELRGAVGGSMHGVYEAGLAINCISNIVTDDLAQDLLPEITNLTQHPQPYLRKKAILCLFKLFVKYPQGLRLTFDRLQKCLEDSNQSVVSCAVNVITELSDKNPKNYLHLAPSFFDLLTKSNNNWMLIKVVKLLGSLVPEEPRLARKLLEPLAAIVKSTQAKSLQYEATYAITLCLPYCRKSDGSMPAIVPEIVTLCAQTLRTFVEETDQNLKYLGLVGFGSLIQSHPRVLSAPDYRPLILACLSDQDVTIRRRALDLLKAMASRKNLIELVTQLLKHVEQATGSYKNDLVAKIVDMCRSEKYSLLQDFGWYLDVLFLLGHMRDVEPHAELLRVQITDVGLRVLPVRGYAVRKSLEVLLEGEGSARNGGQGDFDDDGRCCDNGRGKHIMPEILPAIAWIIGEYSDLIREALSMRKADDDSDEEEGFVYDEATRGSYHAVIQALTAPMNTENLPTSTQKVYVQATMKVFAAATTDKKCAKSELEACVETIHSNMHVYTQSTDVEVAERANTAIEILNSLTLTKSYVFGLAGAGADDSSDDNEQGDLLGIGQQDQKIDSERTHSAPSLIRNIKDSSALLNYLYKPSPMKPVGAKTQRKKRSSLVGTISVDLDAPVDVSVFKDIIAEEEQYRAGTQLSMEAVSFTQQQPLQVEEPVMTSISSSSPMDAVSSSRPMPGFGSSTPMMTGSSTSSFQKPLSGSSPTAGTSPARQRQGDPFYLDSTPAPANGNAAHQEDSRFGTIQLLDSDDDEEPGRRKRGKKEKKAKKAKNKLQAGSNENNLLSFGDGVSSPPVTVYESDDDDDHDDRTGSLVGNRKGPSKEFEGLAKVDLTTPLREDEVMPERKHRVVAPRPVEEAKLLKAKKKTKKKSKKKGSAEPTSGDAVGDLLGLDGFGLGSASAAPNLVAATTPASATTTSAVNAAFDDLLGLDAPAPAPLLGGGGFGSTPPAQQQTGLSEPVSAPSPSKKNSKRPWMKATIKVSSSRGTSNTDWSVTSLSYRVYSSSHDGRPAASIALRFDNHCQSPVVGLSLEFRDKPGEAIDIGTVASDSYAETSKVGPFAFLNVDASQDCKGMLRTADGCEVPVKFSLPASLHLSPEENLTLDQVGQELSSGGWSSDSAKIEVSSEMPPDRVMTLLCNFLRAAEVADSSPSSAVGTLAAYSASSGARVRALVKIKDKSAKVDIRCTSASLGKALAADCKRLVL